MPIGRRFQPGQSGNPGGRPKKRLIDDLLEELLEQNDSEVAKTIAAALIKKARKGDVKAIQLAAERTQGKAKQAVMVSGPDGQKMEMVVTLVGDRAKPTD